jgi:multiple sugar transport system substrate-binding protein
MKSSKLTVFILSFALLAGCGSQSSGGASNSTAGNGNGSTGDGTNTAAVAKAHDPVNLKVLIYADKMDQDEFNKVISGPVQKKYPYITLTYALADKGKGSLPEAIDKLVAAGDLPDIMLTYDLRIRDFNEKKLSTDLTPWIKSQKFDLSKLDPVDVDTVRAYGEEGQLLALPWSINFSATFYNKDIFDKFGVAYPKDGITWDQAIDLAKKVTRTEDGKEYKGLDPGLFKHVMSERSVQAFNPKTNKANLQTDEMKVVGDLFAQISKIPGNVPSDGAAYGVKVGRFFDDQNWAMKPMRSSDVLGSLDKMAKAGQALNWDMASYPSFKDRLGVGMKSDVTVALIAATSKHKDEAFDVISFLTGVEAQTAASENGRIPVLNDKKVQDAYGKALPYFNGKNIKAAFYNKQPMMTIPSAYDDIVIDKMGLNVTDAITAGTDDLNTILRKAEEDANKAIAEKMN